MNKPRIIAALTAGLIASLAAVPIFASAQSGTPPPPHPPYASLYGKAEGSQLGQPVIAFVVSGGTTTQCGVDEVKFDNEQGWGNAYAVTINSDGHVTGCGAPGREVQLYFAPHNGSPGSFATQALTLVADQPQREHHVSLGTPLSNRLLAPHVASHVSR